MDLRRVINELYPNQNDPSPDFSSYAAMVAAWRSGVPPTQQQVNDKWAALQAADAAIQFEKDRKAEYKKQGLTLESMVLALWEKSVEGKSEKADELQVDKGAIDAQFPKP